MRGASERSKAPAFAVARRRRAFGLDAPRPPDAGRVEAAILAWIAAKTPQVLGLRVAQAEADPTAGRSASTLLLLLPGGRAALLRIEVTAGRMGTETLVLAERCRSRRIPMSVVADVEEVRAALRRFGIEAEEA